MLNNRAIEIVKDLIDHEEIAVKELAEKFKTTTRTIYYDLENINYFLNQNGFQGSLKNGKKIFFNIEEKDEIKKIVGNGSVFSPEERKDYLIIKLFFKGIIKLSKEMKNLEVTRKTIENDIKEIKKEFARYEIEVISLSGKGITYRGKELGVRTFFVRYLIKLFVQKHNLKSLISDCVDEVSEICHGQKIEKLIKLILKRYNIKASIFEYYGLFSVVITEVMLKKNKMIFIDEGCFTDRIKFKEEDRKKIKECIENFGFSFNVCTENLLLHVIERRCDNISGNYMDKYLAAAYIKTMNFIKDFQKYYSHDFWSEKVKKALVSKFETAEYKYQFNVRETLGVQGDFPKRLKPLYKRIKSISEKYFGELLEEDLERIAYVIGDFINQEEAKIKSPKKVIVVHYNLGVNLERNIGKHLSSLWHLKVINIVAGYDLENFLEENQESIDGIIIFENGYLRSIKTDIPVIPLNIFQLEETSEILADYGFNKRVKY